LPLGQDSFSPQGNTKCKEATEGSKKYNLWNILKTYKNYHPDEIKNNSFLHRILEPYNEITKPINFLLILVIENITLAMKNAEKIIVKERMVI
jgi:hypothetical protein